MEVSSWWDVCSMDVWLDVVVGGVGGVGASLSSSVERSKGASGESSMASMVAWARALRTARSNSFSDILFLCRISLGVGKEGMSSSVWGLLVSFLPLVRSLSSGLS